ncbi:MAG: hypothetical protein ACOYIG_11855 [Acetivibrionales bacterium]|jgi:hypothetical protein
MINIDKIEVFNFEGAIHGLRNPMNSWHKSDSTPAFLAEDERFHFGPNDLDLAQRMIAAGSDESKFMRQIFVTMDIDAPLYWWKEMDTYKVATVANSCSTMHKLATTPITKDCFSFDSIEDLYYLMEESFEDYVQDCEKLRMNYIKTKDKRYWRALIQMLPSSWNQKRTWTANYQTLRAIYFARRYHKLVEWHEFCRMIEKLLYGKELICYQKEIKE